ncbi:hypothetical protein ACJIZ3_011932 [Penstemon smallii]|uniref:Uncharacterized protein n=1 Tax=Penstemon smallii TaxID=265156 RepID=A0ABD3ULW5_9LAMI
MQIIQWLSKVAHEPQRVTNSSSVTKKQETNGHRVESNNIVVFKNCGIRRRHLNYRVEQSKLKFGKLNIFYFLQSKDVSKGCFYRTLNLKRLGSFRRKQQNSVHSMQVKKEEKADSSSHVGNRVLPITDPTHSSSSSSNDKVQCTNVEDKGKTKTRTNKTKTISRMKELLKWAAAAKAEKGGGKKVLDFRSRAALPDEYQLRDDSPKINFSSSVISVNSTPLHVRNQHVDGRGNWITTDSEFVVLEL